MICRLGYGIDNIPERSPGPFLRKPRGTAYNRNDLSNAWWKELHANPNLAPIKAAGLVLHGLRATAIVSFRKRGLNTLQISSIVGMSLPMVERYCRLADKSELALAAVHFLRGPEAVTIRDSKPTRNY